ncbi:hypothetical protein [Aliamphritea spongicola]|nr:hypothetical protein [Aliamphritea spongicola]
MIGGVLLLIILALSLAGVMIGVSQIQPDQALGILLHGFSPDGLGRFIEPDWRNSQAVIINELRAPG